MPWHKKGHDRILKVTVYIVDDEPMAVQYLEILLKGTSLEIQVLGTAQNGVKAIPEIIKLHPDFVFVDIDMPVMDGLQMSEEVLKQNPAQKIFMLTAYRDFEYAKKSVRIGVSDYILKNELSEAALEELIRRNAAELELEKRHRHTIMETNLRKFFLSDTHPDMGEDWIYKDRPLQRYVLLYIAPRPKIVLKHEDCRYGGYADCYEIESSITEPGIVCRAFVQMFRNEYCGIFSTQQDTEEIMQKCRKIAEDIIERFGEDMPDHVCLISSPVSRFFMLPNMYDQLRGTMEFLYAGTGRVYVESEILLPDIPEGNLNQDTWLMQWRQILEKGNQKEADTFLEEHLKTLRESLGVWAYTEKIQEICRNMKAILKEKKFDPQILNMTSSYMDVQLLERDLRDSQGRYLAEQQERREKNYSRHIILAREYIQNHYSQDISVADIAEAAGISEGHLRRCFKKEMNVNVVNYLTDYRLNRAKRLMKGSRETIEEIWKRTGFTSGQYFSYVFKKKEGITPRDYMRMTDNESGDHQNI